jgi:hypothetical protein
MTDPFSLLLRGVRVVRVKRKQTSGSHMVVLRLSSNLHLITLMTSCRRPKDLQEKLRERSPENDQENTMASPREP